MLKMIDQAEVELEKENSDFDGSVRRNTLQSEFSAGKKGKKKINLLQAAPRRGYSVIENKFKSFDSNLSLGFIKATLQRDSRNSGSIVNNQNEVVNIACGLFILFHQIVVVLSDFSAGALDLTKVVGPSRSTSFYKFVSFL